MSRDITVVALVAILSIFLMSSFVIFAPKQTDHVIVSSKIDSPTQDILGFQEENLIGYAIGGPNCQEGGTSSCREVDAGCDYYRMLGDVALPLGATQVEDLDIRDYRKMQWIKAIFDSPVHKLTNYRCADLYPDGKIDDVDLKISFQRDAAKLYEKNPHPGLQVMAMKYVLRCDEEDGDPYGQSFLTALVMKKALSGAPVMEWPYIGRVQGGDIAAGDCIAWDANKDGVFDIKDVLVIEQRFWQTG